MSENLRRADLNLLIVFDAVADTRSATLAADRLAMSQPAVSHALKRLRLLFDDPLFTRGRSELVLTDRARELIQPVRDILDAANSVLSKSAFCPRATERQFRIATGEHGMLTIIPGLMQALNQHAPKAKLEVQTANRGTFDLLEDGSVDLALWGMPPPSSPYRSEVLFHARSIGVMSETHPLAAKLNKAGISLEDYLAFAHAVPAFQMPAPMAIDAALSKLGRKREAAVTTSSFVGNLKAVRGTQLLSSIPSSISGKVDLDGLRTFDLPFNVPVSAFSAVWHRRTDSSPDSQWLRATIRASLNASNSDTVR